MLEPNIDPSERIRWQRWQDEWHLRLGVTYLNHGSFGPSPRMVRDAYRHWAGELEAEPVDFFNRQMPPLLAEARRLLGRFVGTSADNIVFIENATAGMNAVAESVRLQPGDEVLTTDHDYGAVVRIWQRACDLAGARLVVQPVPVPVESSEALIAAVMAGVSDRTKLLVFSHVTSPTALIFPAAELTRQARQRGLVVCIDGPHAPAMIPIDLDQIDCDFYTASCHKWLSGPFGSGFLYAHQRVQATVRPAVLSWGRHPPNQPTPASWTDEFTWAGTRDPATYLAVPAAIDFLVREVGLDAFRQRTHSLACLARQSIEELTGMPGIVPDSPGWYGSMITLPPPPGDAFALQDALWQRHRIEAPIIAWNGQRYIRVSFHLYNDEGQIKLLVACLQKLLLEM